VCRDEFDADQHLADTGFFRLGHITIFDARNRIAIGCEHDCFHNPFLSRLVISTRSISLALMELTRASLRLGSDPSAQPADDGLLSAVTWKMCRRTSAGRSSTPSLMGTRSATIQFAGWPRSENRPCDAERADVYDLPCCMTTDQPNVKAVGPGIASPRGEPPVNSSRYRSNARTGLINPVEWIVLFATSDWRTKLISQL
jgi:hypothetical protein